MASSQEIVKTVERMTADFLAEHGLELYHADFRKTGKDWTLTVYIDKKQDDPNGQEKYVDTDDCELVTRYLSDRLDEEDPIPQAYTLIVSSAGMDRELYEEAHFERFRGRLVDVKFYQSVDGEKSVEGTLEGLKDGIVTIRREDGGELQFPRSAAAKISLAVVF